MTVSRPQQLDFGFKRRRPDDDTVVVRTVRRRALPTTTTKTTSTASSSASARRAPAPSSSSCSSSARRAPAPSSSSSALRAPVPPSSTSSSSALRASAPALSSSVSRASAPALSSSVSRASAPALSSSVSRASAPALSSSVSRAPAPSTSLASSSCSLRAPAPPPSSSLSSLLPLAPSTSSAGANRAPPQAFSLRPEGTENRCKPRHGKVAEAAARQVLGLGDCEWRDTDSLVGKRAFATTRANIEVKWTAVVNPTTSKTEWRVRALGFGKDTRGKKTVTMFIFCSSAEHAEECREIWTRKIDELWQTHDFQQIRDETKYELYQREAAGQLDSEQRFLMQNHALQTLMRHRRCTLFASGECSVQHLCATCKLRIWSCVEVGVEMQCFACSIRHWGATWRKAKLEYSISDINRRDSGRHADRTSLTLEAAQHLVVSLLPMSPARYDTETHASINILCEALTVLVSRSWQVVDDDAASIPLPPLPDLVALVAHPSDDPCRLGLCTTDLVAQPIFFGYSLFLNFKERLAALSPSIDLRFQHDLTHTADSCWRVPRWFNVAKGRGLGVMVELHTLAAQLHHSLGARAELTLREIASIVGRLESTDRASRLWQTSKRGGSTEDIEHVEDLFSPVATSSTRAAAVIHRLPMQPFVLGQDSDCSVAKIQEIWQATQPYVHRFVVEFVEPFVREHPHLLLKRNGDGFPTLCLPAHTSTYDVCAFLAARTHRAIALCDAKNKRQLEADGVLEDAELDDADDIEDSADSARPHQHMGPLAVAAFMLMSASEAELSRVLATDPFDGRSFPDAWSGLPLFSAATTLIAHKAHARFFHLGFSTNTPVYGDWDPARVDASMQLNRSNFTVQRLRLSTLVAILTSTRSLSRTWLRTLAREGLVSGASAIQGLEALDSELNVMSLRQHFGTNGVSRREFGWQRHREQH